MNGVIVAGDRSLSDLATVALNSMPTDGGQAAKRRKHGTRSSAVKIAGADESSMGSSSGAVSSGPSVPKEKGAGRKRKAATTETGEPKLTAAEERTNWTKEQDAELKLLVDTHGGKEWKKIALLLQATPGKPTEKEPGGFKADATQCLHRWSKVLRPGLKKGKWSAEEDQIMKDMVAEAGGIEGVKWAQIAARCTGRLGKQCRERWLNHLDPNISKQGWTTEEDQELFDKHTEIGNQWTKLAEHFPGRTENGVKNRFHSAGFRKWCVTMNYSRRSEKLKGGPTKKDPADPKEPKASRAGKPAIEGVTTKPPASSSPPAVMPGMPNVPAGPPVAPSAMQPAGSPAKQTAIAI